MNTIERIINWSRLKSPWIIHFNSGACNACDIEVLAAPTPRYDVERFGVQAEGLSPPRGRARLSGLVTPQQRDRLTTIYQQMPRTQVRDRGGHLRLLRGRVRRLLLRGNSKASRN